MDSDCPFGIFLIKLFYFSLYTYTFVHFLMKSKIITNTVIPNIDAITMATIIPVDIESVRQSASVFTNTCVISVYHHYNIVSLNPAHGEVYSIQHYVITFVSDLRQVGGFLRVFRFPPPIKLTTTILLKYC